MKNKCIDKSDIGQLLLTRRNFTGLTALLVSGLFGCAHAGGPKGELKIVTNGFKVYRGRNPKLRFPHGTYSTWVNLLQDYGYKHTGYSYTLPGNEPIVACASGKVIEAYLRIGSGRNLNKESGDIVTILHEPDFNWVGNYNWGGIKTTYYHMRSNSRQVSFGDKVNRGDILGYEGAPHNMHVKHYLRTEGFNREQPNNWGINHGYMDYWDGKTELDFPRDIVEKRNRKQISLIREFNENYMGPGFEHVRFIYNSGFMHRGRWAKEDTRWSPIEMFKLAEYIFRRSPELFKGSKKNNENLISGIYENQPIILTLPLKKH